jgi:hypothetical protein
MLDTPDLDSKMPSQPTGEDALAQNFEREWEKAERRVQSVLDVPSQEPREGSVNQEIVRHGRREPGAFRAINPAASASRAHTPPGDTGEMAEQKSVSTLSNPIIEAHVIAEDQALQFERLNQAVTSLQQHQLQIMEARVVRAQEVIVEDTDDDAPSFLEMYSTTIIMTCLAFGVGILVGSRTRHSGG